MRLVKRILIVAAPIALLSVAWLFRQNILDWWVLANYQPSHEISLLSQQSSFSSHGQKLFYLTDPQIKLKTDFSDYCTYDEKSIILGCFDGRQIFILSVENPELNGIEEVTAAHEMLHMAYSRLQKDQKLSVDALLKRQLEKISDARLLSVVEYYLEKDEASLNNELHSIIGTEVRDLDPELEQYYSQYFIDRLYIVGLAEKYATTFVSIENKIAEYDSQLEQLDMSISSKEDSLGLLYDEIILAESRITGLASAGNRQEYEIAYAEYLRQVDEYNQLLQELNQEIEQYNLVVGERNALANHQNDLIDSISSSGFTSISNP